ncbi:hypothetical protein ACLMJK_007106 [Lecanora helva]
MRGRELKQFILPQLVEARKRGEDDVESSPMSSDHAQRLSRSSTLSDTTSPMTPTFSTRGHSRLPSSASSLASSPALHESIEGFASTTKRPLTDVREEPQDKDEDYEMVNAPEERYSYEEGRSSACFDDHVQCADCATDKVSSDFEETLYRTSSMEFSSAYDLADDPGSSSDFTPNPRAKRRRAEDVPLSPMDGLTSRFGSRMPSFSRSLSRKFKPRKASPTIAMPDRSQEINMSRANSTRAPSLAGSAVEVEVPRGPQLPPTPRRSIADDRFEDAYRALTNGEKPNAGQISEEDEAVDCPPKPTTPLLPPIMTQLPSNIREVPYQSPLQSPSVAEPEAPSVLNSPLPTPRIAGLPSPPLSSKPSRSSFHPQRGIGPVSPSADIPTMSIAEPNDKWADQLGHANFNIQPEPYVAKDTTLMACKQVRADWEAAKLNYMNHLNCVGEHYGTTSKIYRLTEEKWSEVDAHWKRNVEISFSRIPQLPTEPAATLTAPPAQPDPTTDKTAPLTKIPSPEVTTVSSPKSDYHFAPFGEGKFPALGDEGIVGPMEVVAPQEPQRRNKRKLGFIRWVQGVWPVGANALGRRHSSGN